MKKLKLNIKNKDLIIEDANVVADLRKSGAEIIGSVAKTFLTLIEDIINVSVYAISAIVTIFASQRVKDRIKNRYRRAYQQINSDYDAQIKSLEIEESNLIYFLIQPGMFVSNKIAEELNSKLSSRGFDDLLDGLESLITNPFGTIAEITGLSRLGKINFSRMKEKFELDLINSNEAKDLGAFFDAHPIKKEKDQFLRSLRRRNLTRSAKFFENILKEKPTNENKKTNLRIANNKLLINESTKAERAEDFQKYLVNILSNAIIYSLEKVSRDNLDQNKDVIQKNFNLFKQENQSLNEELNLILSLLSLFKSLIENNYDENNALKTVKSLTKQITDLNASSQEKSKVKDFLKKVELFLQEKDKKDANLDKIKSIVKNLQKLNYTNLIQEYKETNSLYVKAGLNDESGIIQLEKTNNNIVKLLQEFESYNG